MIRNWDSIEGDPIRHISVTRGIGDFSAGTKESTQSNVGGLKEGFGGEASSLTGLL